MDQLDALRAKHRATARYTLYLAEYGRAKEVIAVDLDYETAIARMSEHNKQVSGFTRPLYGVELQRQTSIGT